METLLKFDRVVLTKELNDKIKNIGEVFEVANILEGSFLLREEKSKVAVGVVSFEDFDQHFVKEEDFKGWTDWAPFATDYEEGLKVFYRVKNKKKIQVKIADGYVGEASCNNKFGDEFNLYIGLNLAFLRCINKMYSKKIEDYQLCINTYEDKIRYIQEKIKQINKTLR